MQTITQTTIIGATIHRDCKAVLLRSDFSYAIVPSRDVFDDVVNGLNATSGQMQYLHDYERRGVVRCDNLALGRVRIFPTYTEFYELNNERFADWVERYWVDKHPDGTPVEWKDGLKEIADTYKAIKAEEVPRHSVAVARFDLEDQEALELMLRVMKHPKRDVKRNWLRTAVLAAKRRDYNIHFAGLRTLRVELSGPKYR